MTGAFYASIGAILPIFMMIMGGLALRESKIMPAESWGDVNRITFNVLAPMYVLDLVAKADISGAGVAKLSAALVLGVTIMALGALATRPLLKINPSYACVFQSAVRWNGVMILAAAPSLMGREGAAMLAIAFAPITLTANVMAVIGFNLWGGRESPRKDWVMSFFMNPLLLGCAIGALMLLVKFRIPEPFGGIVHMFGQASVPLMLLCVGAGLNFKAVAAAPAYMIAGIGLRLIWGPASMLIAAELLGMQGISKLVLIAAGSTPTAASGYVLARQMGGDDKLMAGLVTATTLLSAITIPLALSFAAGRL